MKIAILMALLLGSAAWAQTEPGETDVVVGSQYIELKPAFVTNYGGPGPLRFLKAEIALRVSGGEQGIRGVRHHMPYIRHELIMLLSAQNPEDLETMEGKELLRQSALAAVRNVLIEEEGNQYVDDLLFNNFIVQR
ncbi:MAG TPA: flagellar basal body-associated FliL family protein [Spongiibacteraceae bacterium]|jgi:flagellar FliL protein|nr:flagellar basal body-associated FliL family protein [Spongiibacteraceae bacterium]HUH36716.1 flagellar basal body-associated FliL family protein [Spongiibacteraceae bacterium]